MDYHIFWGSNCLFLGYLCYFCKLNAGQGLKMILEWLEQHKEELMDNWEKAQKGDPLKKIEPLKQDTDMFTEVVKAEYVDGYRIRLWFNNQVTKVVDLRTSLKGKVFEPLKDLNFFKRFTVKYNTIEWENGADFAPEYLLSLPEA